MKILNAKVWTDGKSSPNPGVSTFGFRVKFYDLEWKELPELMVDGYGKMSGVHTNNEAEYAAWLYALRALGRGGSLNPLVKMMDLPGWESLIIPHKPDIYKVVHFHTDSELVYSQNTATWMSPFNQISNPARHGKKRGKSQWNARVRKPELRQHKQLLWALLRDMPIVERICLSLLPREENTEADYLTNLAMSTLKEGETVLTTYKEATENASIPTIETHVPAGEHSGSVLSA